MLKEWKKLGEYIIVKFNDMVVKKGTNGKYDLTPPTVLPLLLNAMGSPHSTVKKLSNEPEINTHP